MSNIGVKRSPSIRIVFVCIFFMSECSISSEYSSLLSTAMCPSEEYMYSNASNSVDRDHVTNPYGSPEVTFNIQNSIIWKIIQICISLLGFTLNALAFTAFVLHGKGFTKELRILLAHQV